MTENRESDQRNDVQPDEMEYDEIAREYQDLKDADLSGGLEDPLIDRLVDLWDELRERSAVEQPECPACGARNWRFIDHTECAACDYAPEMDEQDLLNDIQVSWQKILAGTGGDDKPDDCGTWKERLGLEERRDVDDVQDQPESVDIDADDLVDELESLENGGEKC